MPQGFTLKNSKLNNGTVESVVLPVGTAAQRPATPSVGATRFNITSGNLEVYNGSAWDSLALEGMVDITVDTFTGDGSTTVFGSMTYAVDYPENILVFISGVYQSPTMNYTVDGSYDVTFLGAAPNNSMITILHGVASTQV